MSKRKKQRRKTRVDEVQYEVGTPPLRVSGDKRRVDKQWSRMTRINVEPDVWIAFRKVCDGREQAVSDGLAELVRREVRAAQRAAERP